MRMWRKTDDRRKERCQIRCRWPVFGPSLSNDGDIWSYFGLFGCRRHQLYVFWITQLVYHGLNSIRILCAGDLARYMAIWCVSAASHWIVHMSISISIQCALNTQTHTHTHTQTSWRNGSLFMFTIPFLIFISLNFYDRSCALHGDNKYKSSN